MAYAKNKNLNRRSLASSSRSSRQIHRPRARSTLLPASPAGRLTLAIIIIVTVLVIFAGAFSFLASPSRLAKNELKNLAENYYENTFYTNIHDQEQLSRYETSGLATVTLRQLLLSDKEKSKDLKALKKYCDENETTVKFYPISPFNKTDYRIEYIYSCNF